MSIDDRLRESLRWDPSATPSTEPALLDMIVGRATRRRRLRLAAVGLTAAVAALLATIVGASMLSDSMRGDEPVQPSPVTDTWTPTLPAGTPVDGRWEAWTGERADRLAAIDGTSLESYGDAIYRRYFAAATVGVYFNQGTVTLYTIGVGTTLGAHDYKAYLHGTFTVQDRTVVMEFDEVNGSTVLRWTKADDSVGQDLQLTLIRTTAGSLFGAPAEAFLRVWSAGPLKDWGCC
jgi:hypothetical protein